MRLAGRPTSRAAGTRSSSARPGCRSAPTTSCRRRSTGSSPGSTGSGRRSPSRRSPRSPTGTWRFSAWALRATPRIAPAVENYLRRAKDGAAFRISRSLDRQAISRAHDVFYASDAWTKATWLGAQALKNPLDLWVYQEILFETRPELIVETGTYRGGSALFLASMCDLLGAGEVVSIDIEPLRADYPEHPRITYLGGRSSTDPGVLDEVRGQGRRPPAPRRPRLRPLPGARRGRAPGICADGSRGVLRHRRGLEHRADPEGPDARAAAGDRDVPGGNREFEIDRAREKFLITFNPSGYLRRVAPASS